MKDYSFNTWLHEYADFGLDMSKRPSGADPEQGEKPIMPLSVEYVVNFLKRKQLGEKTIVPNDLFGEIQWGDQDGALLISFSPFRGNHATLRKLTHDLEGNPQWICKRVIEIKNLFDSHPDKLIFILQESLDKIDNEGIEAPSENFADMQDLVIQLASELRRKTTQKIFMYEGIRVVKENFKYIIHFGVTGMGVQRRGQKRLDQFAIHAEYDKKIGLIKITGTPLGDVISKHRWIYDPSAFIEWFSPYQSEDEINDAVLVNFNCY